MRKPFISFHRSYPGLGLPSGGARCGSLRSPPSPPHKHRQSNYSCKKDNTGGFGTIADFDRIYPYLESRVVEVRFPWPGTIRQLFGEGEAACSPGCRPSKSSGRGWGRGEYGLTGSGPSPSEARALQSPVTEQARGATGAENTVADEPKASQIFICAGLGQIGPRAWPRRWSPLQRAEPPLTSHPLVLSCGNPPRFTIFT